MMTPRSVNMRSFVTNKEVSLAIGFMCGGSVGSHYILAGVIICLLNCWIYDLRKKLEEYEIERENWRDS